MKKICYFINTDWYFELHWIERASYAKKNGYEVHVISDFNNPMIMEKLINLGFFCHKLDVKSQSLNPLIFIWHTIQSCIYFSRIKADIIHAITIKPCIFAGFYAFFTRKKLVLSIVGLGRLFSAQTQILSLVSRVVLPLYKVLLKNRNLFVIFEHKADRENFIFATGVDESRTIVIDGAGIDTNLYNFEPEFSRPRPVVLFAARMLRRKGLVDLIAAKKILEKKNVFFDIHVAGIQVVDSDAISKAEIQNWIDDSSINWLGNKAEMKPVIANANIVALPSTYPEGVPRILIESAAVGRALIAYDSGGCFSIVEDGLNGFLVEKENINLFAEKLEILILDNEKRRVMAEYGRNLVLKKFDSELVLSQTVSIYDLLCHS